MRVFLKGTVKNNIERKIPTVQQQQCYEQNGVDGSGGQNQITDEQKQEMEEEIKRIRQLIIEHRRKKFAKDYKTWAYLFFCSAVVIAAIVLIVLAGMGIIEHS